VASSKYYPSILLEGLRTTKGLSDERRCPGETRTEHVPPQCKSTTLPLLHFARFEITLVSAKSIPYLLFKPVAGQDLRLRYTCVCVRPEGCFVSFYCQFRGISSPNCIGLLLPHIQQTDSVCTSSKMKLICKTPESVVWITR
jgi:hypothetical protein